MQERRYPDCGEVSEANEAVSRLLPPFAYFGRCPNQSMILYYHCVTERDSDILYALNLFSNTWKDNSIIVEPITSHVCAKIAAVFHQWERYANVKFVEYRYVKPQRYFWEEWFSTDHVDTYGSQHPAYRDRWSNNSTMGIQLPIYQYRDSQPLLTIPSISNVPIQVAPYYLGVGFEHGFLINATNSVFFESVVRDAVTESGLGINLNFRASFIKSRFDYQVSTRQYEYYHSLPIIPITPFPVEIQAAQYRFGVTSVNESNNTYHVFDFVSELFRYGSSAYQTGYTTIATLPYDQGGVDTIDAQGVDVEVTINLNHNTRSQVGYGFFTVVDSTIENVIGGRDKNTVVLNERDNVIDLKDSKQSVIVTHPANCGHDTIIGFVNTRDVIVVPCDFKDRLRFWMNTTKSIHSTSEIQLNTTASAYDMRDVITRIQFYDNHSIMLVHPYSTYTNSSINLVCQSLPSALFRNPNLYPQNIPIELDIEGNVEINRRHYNATYNVNASIIPSFSIIAMRQVYARSFLEGLLFEGLYIKISELLEMRQYSLTKIEMMKCVARFVFMYINGIPFSDSVTHGLLALLLSSNNRLMGSLYCHYLKLYQLTQVASSYDFNRLLLMTAGYEGGAALIKHINTVTKQKPAPHEVVKNQLREMSVASSYGHLKTTLRFGLFAASLPFGGLGVATMSVAATYIPTIVSGLVGSCRRVNHK